MAASPYGIFLLLLIPGAICYSLKSHLRSDSGTLQKYLNRTDGAASLDRGSPHLPNLMLSLYQRFHHLDTKHGVGLTPATLLDFPSSQADIIRSLAAKSIDKMAGRCVLVFDFSSLSSDEELQFAEVRIRTSALEKPFGEGSQLFMDVFHHDSACERSSDLCKNYVYLGTSKSEPQSRTAENWIVVDATEIVSKWFYSYNKSDIHLEKLRERLPGTESAKKRYKKHTSEDQQVLMFVYSNMSKKERSLVTATLLQDATHSKYLSTMPSIKNITVSRRRRRSHMIKDQMKQAPPVDNPRNLCRRVDFIVDFKMIGWDAWIIHPKKFNAYRCEGTCPSPVNEGVKPNNHAYLQSLVNFYNSENAPEVCCVPTKMSSLSMAYFDKTNIAFQVHEAMVVEECGCQ
ncbi:nodal homolog [Phyllobates terribilis]|uniref:nodal homolog n=1 Tax=Phyllobates terribilis TaxID=111132 RepID=UPI003CCB169E